MSRAHRLLDLLQELRGRRRPVTARALADALGVSVRTLYRDIDTLRAQGATIEGEAGLGYVLRPGYLLPPLMFTAEESEALALGAAWVARRRDLGLADAARSALAKIAAVAPAELRDRVDAAAPLLGRVPEGVAPTIDVDILRAALRAERKLKLAYVDGVGAATERIVWPVALAVFAETRLLAAWCELRGAYRHFRLDRIQTAQALEARLPRRHAALLKEWRALEPECVPEGVHEVR